jgi:hypothetical protein
MTQRCQPPSFARRPAFREGPCVVQPLRQERPLRLRSPVPSCRPVRQYSRQPRGTSRGPPSPADASAIAQFRQRRRTIAVRTDAVLGTSVHLPRHPRHLGTQCPDSRRRRPVHRGGPSGPTIGGQARASPRLSALRACGSRCRGICRRYRCCLEFQRHGPCHRRPCWAACDDRDPHCHRPSRDGSHYHDARDRTGSQGSRRSGLRYDRPVHDGSRCRVPSCRLTVPRPMNQSPVPQRLIQCRRNPRR